MANLARVERAANEENVANVQHSNQRSESGLTAYDALLARRTAALGTALAVLAFLAMLGTDDAASTNAGRLGRLSALASLAGAGGVFIALAQARSRGEMRALSAAGVTPARAAAGAVAGGALVGLLGAALACVPGVDLTPLFPHALPAEGGFVSASGAWVDVTRGIRVAPDGAITRIGAPMAVDVAASSTPLGATVVALAFAAVAFPLWAAAPRTVVRRAAMSFAVASAAVFVFHLVAAHRIGAITLVAPPLLLLLDALILHRGRAWS
jgi:hypothetical protein